MQVANLELCKELYEVSGWGDGTLVLHSGGYPLYDLGYLLRKLPDYVVDHQLNLGPEKDGSWNIAYIRNDTLLDVVGIIKAPTPEDAAAKLASELFKQKFLTKESK